MNENEVVTGAEVNVKKPSAFSKFVKKHPVFTCFVCGLVVVAVVYFWKDVQGNLKRKAVIELATVQLQDNNKKMLQLFCKPLVWNVRSEMLRGNMEQVNMLISELVREKHFQSIDLLDLTGKVLLSTNKKMEGQPIQNEKIISALSADSTVFINEDGNLITLVAPVMGYDKKLGTLVVSYLPEAFNAGITIKK